jgi:hypothetical protein
VCSQWGLRRGCLQAGVTSCWLAVCGAVCVQADVYERLDALDSDTTEARAASILHGLGFDAHMQVRGTCRLILWVCRVVSV